MSTLLWLKSCVCPSTCTSKRNSWMEGDFLLLGFTNLLLDLLYLTVIHLDAAPTGTLCLSWILNPSLHLFPAQLFQSPLGMAWSSLTATFLQSSSMTRRACTLCLNFSESTATRERSVREHFFFLYFRKVSLW